MDSSFIFSHRKRWSGRGWILQRWPVQQDNRININTADEAQLTTLTGIGATRAQAIIAYREENGPFAAIEDIMNVQGIKEGTFAKIKDEIVVG